MRLSDERYEEIKEEVADVYEELHITKFPVKCMEVCKEYFCLQRQNQAI